MSMGLPLARLLKDSSIIRDPLNIPMLIINICVITQL